MTGMARPPTGQIRGQRPGTGMRPGTIGRPGTGRVGTAGGAKIAPHVGQRSVISQGLGGLSTSGAPPGTSATNTRFYADNTYFANELRRRTSELKREMESLESELEQFQKDNEASFQFERRNEALQGDIEGLTTDLGALNLVLEKLHISPDGNLNPSDIADEAVQLASKNEAESRRGDSIFRERQYREAGVREKEDEIKKAQKELGAMIESLNSTDRERYDSLVAQNQEAMDAISEKQRILESLEAEAMALEDEVGSDPGRRTTLSMHERMRQLKSERQRLMIDLNMMSGEESSTVLSVPQEIERLTREVKVTNSELGKISNQTSTCLDAINKLRSRLSQLEQTAKESKGDRATKFRALVKKDKEMTRFLENWNQERTVLLDSNTQLEAKITQGLDSLSQIVHRGENIPTGDSLKQLQEALYYKENQMEHSQNTAVKLGDELSYRKMELQKMHNLDHKIQEETTSLRDKMTRMTEELKSFEEAPQQIAGWDREKERIVEQKKTYARQKEMLSQQNEIKRSNEMASYEKELRANEMHSQLEVLEKSLRHYAQNNFSMWDYIATKKKEADYGGSKEQSLQLVDQLNELCKSAAM